MPVAVFDAQALVAAPTSADVLLVKVFELVEGNAGAAVVEMPVAVFDAQALVAAPSRCGRIGGEGR